MATGALAPVPLQWFDNAGAVLAGGRITTYLTGTTTATSTTQPDRSRAAGTGGRTLPPRNAKK